MAFDFTSLPRAYGSLYRPRILGTIAGDDSAKDRQIGHATWKEEEIRRNDPAYQAYLAQQDQYWDAVNRQQEQVDLERRQQEKEAYAKWEREQILNKVADQIFQDKKATGEFTGITDSQGNQVYRDKPFSQQQSDLYAAAAKEAASRGAGGAAQEFLQQGQKYAMAADQERKADLENQLKQKQLEANKREFTPLTNEAGDVTLLDANGNVIKTIQGAGKPSGTYEKTQAAKQKLGNDLDFAIGELTKATADGGLLDKATGSGIGALADTAAGFFGHATEGSIAAAQMKPIYDLVLKMVPRFEGPQSDKDTQAYREAAGQLGNPAVPNEQKKAAANEILRLMKERKGQFTNQEGDVSSAGNQASYAPSYIETRTLPDGRRIGRKVDGSLEIIK